MHFWYNTWPDHGVPRDMRTGELNCHAILEMLADVRKFTKTLPNKPPTVVHCSAGIGRTGTYIGLDICTNQLLLTSQIDVVATVEAMRNDRGALVQHDAQMTFLHKCVVQFATAYGHGPDDIKADRTLGTVRIAGQTFSFIDIDGDGSMSMAEAAKQGMTELMFSVVDADSSGDISKQEFTAFVQKQAAAARKKDKQVQRESTKRQLGRKPATLMRDSTLNGELNMGLVEVNGVFLNFVDVDGDGDMDMQEALDNGWTAEMFHLVDADGDGAVTKTEFRTFQMNMMGFEDV